LGHQTPHVEGDLDLGDSVDPTEWAKARKLWGTACALENWIGFTLGRAPSCAIDIAERIAAVDPVFWATVDGTGPDDAAFQARALHTADVRISLLGSLMHRSTRAHQGPPTHESIAAIRQHMALLTAWMTTLPRC